MALEVRRYSVGLHVFQAFFSKISFRIKLLLSKQARIMSFIVPISMVDFMRYPQFIYFHNSMYIIYLKLGCAGWDLLQDLLPSLALSKGGAWQ